MGLLARYEYPRREVTYDRAADTVGPEGASISKLTIYRPPGGVGLFQVFYTVPSGKVFLLRSASVQNNTLRLNGQDFISSSTAITENYDPPIKFEAGTTFSGFGNVAGAIIRLVGVEEDESMQAARNAL